MDEFKLETVEAEPFGFLRLEASLAEMSRTIGEGFIRLGELFGKADVKMAGAPYAHYISFEGSKAIFELGFPIAGVQEERLRMAGVEIGRTPDGQVLKGIHMGPYETVSKTYDSMGADLKRRHLQGTPDMWERYYSPPGTPPEKTMTEVIWPIAAAGPMSGPTTCMIPGGRQHGRKVSDDPFRAR